MTRKLILIIQNNVKREVCIKDSNDLKTFIYFLLFPSTLINYLVSIDQ